MNLRPELRAVMSTLGVTEPELETLKARMMFSVMNLEAQVDALWTPQGPQAFIGAEGRSSKTSRRSVCCPAPVSAK